MAVVIALLTAVAVFGVSVVVVSTTQQAGAALDLEGARAYYAARGGLEWGMYHVLRPGFGGCLGISPAPPPPPPPYKVIAYAGNLDRFRVKVECAATPHEEGSAPVIMYEITATACNDATCPWPTVGPSPPAYYVERQLRVTVGSN